MADIRITGADQLYELNKRLKSADKKLVGKLRKAVRDGVKPAVTATKAAITTLPVTGSKGGGGKARAAQHLTRSKKQDEKAQARAAKKSGLRRTISAAIKVKVATGSKTASVKVIVDESQLPPDQRSLPRHLDSATGWRHPTFGHDPWVAQKGRPWFETTLRKHADVVRASVIAAMDDMARELDR